MPKLVSVIQAPILSRFAAAFGEASRVSSVVSAPSSGRSSCAALGQTFNRTTRRNRCLLQGCGCSEVSAIRARILGSISLQGAQLAGIILDLCARFLKRGTATAAAKCSAAVLKGQEGEARLADLIGP